MQMADSESLAGGCCSTQPSTQPSMQPSTQSRQKPVASCPCCCRLIPVTLKGFFRQHGPISARCPGSGLRMTGISSAPITAAAPLSATNFELCDHGCVLGLEGMAANTRCCRCNGSAKCLRCACVRSGSPCSRCLPGVSGNCHNTLPRVLPPSAPASTSPPATTSAPVSSPPPVASPAPVTPALSTILQANVPTLHHVPKGARDCWAHALCSCLRAVVCSPDDLSQWSRLFMLAKCVLASPATGHRLRWREILKRVKSRLQRWADGDLMTLWSEALDDGRSLAKRRHQSASASSSGNFWRAKLAVQDGQYTKAIRALTSEGLASPSPEVLQEMQNKHPQAPPPHVPPGPVPSPASLSEPVILKGVRSFPNASVPGPSGLRPSHLREAVVCPSPDRASQALSSLTCLINLLAAGKAPPSVLPHLCGATLLASRKKSGGHRPIAVGEVLRRLTSKCLASASRHSAISTLTPLQLGVGVRGGCEAIIHATSHLVSSPSSSNQRWCLFLDFSNAFNCISRESMFVEIRRRIPSLAAWMESCYSCQPFLHLGEHSLLSCCGVQQGDPLGPLGFALTLQPLIERLKADVSGLNLNVWYLDDGTLMGSPEDLAAALRIVESEGPPLGLHLNRNKSLLFIPVEADPALSPLPPDIPITRNGFTLLGCPIGPPDYCEEVFQARLSKVKVSLGALHGMGDAQLESTLLRSCLALPKVSFILRTCPPSHIHQTAAEFDCAIHRTLETVLGGPVSHWSWMKATLPSSRGGLNLRSAVRHAPAAFLASVSATHSLVEHILGCPPGPSPHIPPALLSLATEAARPDWQCLEDIEVPLRQRSLSNAMDESCFQQLLTSAPSSRFRALSLSSSLPHAADWLNVVPSSSLGLHLHDREFRCCLRYWLGVPLHSTPYPCPECRCTADPYGDHQVGCGGNGDRIARHNAIRDVIFSAAQSAALAPSKEAPGLVPGSQARPADIFLPSWSLGRPAALDVHVISPLQVLTVADAAFTPGHALQVGVQRKLASNLSACRSSGTDFVPLVAETLGGLAEDTISTITSISRAIADRSSSPDPAATSRHLFGRLAITLWRGNAALWLHRSATLPPSLDGVI